MTAAKEVPTYNFTLTEDERAEMVRILGRAMEESRVEIHRTHTPDYRDRVIGEQALLRGLMEKFQNPRVQE
jgi:hypothetical protein